MRRRLTIVVPCLLLAALIAGHTALWFAAANHLDAGFNTWVAQRRAAGWQVDAGIPVRGGWPLAATLSVPDLALSASPQGAPGVAPQGAPGSIAPQGGPGSVTPQGGPGSVTPQGAPGSVAPQGAPGSAAPQAAPGSVTWRGQRVVLTLAMTSPDRLGIDLLGDQSLRIAPSSEVPFSADRLHVEIPFTRAAPTATASLEVRALHAQGLTIGLLTGQVVAATSPTVTLAAEAIDLPPGIPWALGPHISSLAFDATVEGGLPPPGALPAMAEAWRGAGGTLNVTHLALGWGPLGLSATAKLSFDDHLQPVGTADLHVIGYAKTLEALARQRVITKDTALAATAVLTLLSHTPRDGGAPEVEVPLTLRDHTLLMGKTPLVRVPELTWPQP